MPRLKWPAGYRIACSPDGRLLCALGRNVVMIDLHERRRLWTAHPLSHPSSAAFSPNCKALAVKSTSGHILVLDVETGNVIRDFQNKADGEGSDIAFTADGNHLIDGSWNGVLTIRHAQTAQIVERKENSGEMLVRITHDATRQTWLVMHQPKLRAGKTTPPCSYVSVFEWPLTSSWHARILDFGRDVQAATISPDGQRVCFRDRTRNELVVARIADAEILACTPLSIGGTGAELAWSTDARFIGAVGSEGFRFFRANDLATAGVQPDQYPSSLAFHPHGLEVVLGSWNTTSIRRFEVVW